MNLYKAAWVCLLECLRKNIPLRLWLAPIPEEHKEKMLEAGKRFIAKEKALERVPSLFEEDSIDFTQ